MRAEVMNLTICTKEIDLPAMFKLSDGLQAKSRVIKEERGSRRKDSLGAKGKVHSREKNKTEGREWDSCDESCRGSDTFIGVGGWGTDGLYWVEHGGRQALWTPDGAKPMQKRLLVCAHMQEAGYRGVDAIPARV